MLHNKTISVIGAGHLGCALIRGLIKSGFPPSSIVVSNSNSNSNSNLDYDEFDLVDAVDVILQPGDISVHHPHIIHGSESNRSTKRRCGLDLGYMSTDTSRAYI